MKSTYDKKRLTESSVMDYLKEQYPEAVIVKDERKVVGGYMPLLQRDYGKANDCTLTCITMLVRGLSKNTLSPQEIYEVVESNATKYGYNGDKWGTISLTVKKILDATLKHFKISRSTANRYIKNLGFNLQTIINIIKNGNPVILSMQSDGRKYYGAHSITVMGYQKYRIIESGISSFETVLLIYDNWYNTLSCLPYEPIGTITSINYVK